MSRSEPPRIISQPEWEVIEFCVQIAQLLGFPGSVGKIYGLVFITEQAISADDCVEHLGMSRSSAGQGIRQLAEVGAIRRAITPGERREVYQMEPDLGVLLRSYLSSRFFPTIDDLSLRLARLRENPEFEKNPFLNQRVDKLERWGKKAKPLLSTVTTLFGITKR